MRLLSRLAFQKGLKEFNMFNQGGLKYKGNSTNPSKRAWDEYVDKEGNSTLSEHPQIEVWRACKKHFFISADTLGNVQCRNCGFGQKIAWGIHILKKGKIVKLSPPKL